MNITILILIYIYIYSICDYEEQTCLCDPSLFPLYVFSGLPLSVYRCCMLHRSVLLERLEKKRGRRKKKAKKKLRDASIQYGEKKKKRMILFCFLIEKKSRVREKGVGGTRKRKRNSGKTRALITSLNDLLVRSRCHCRRSWIPAAHKTENKNKKMMKELSFSL